jgi:hypothetical protein
MEFAFQAPRHSGQNQGAECLGLKTVQGEEGGYPVCYLTVLNTLALPGQGLANV